MGCEWRRSNPQYDKDFQQYKQDIQKYAEIYEDLAEVEDGSHFKDVNFDSSDNVLDFDPQVFKDGFDTFKAAVEALIPPPPDALIPHLYAECYYQDFLNYLSE